MQTSLFTTLATSRLVFGLVTVVGMAMCAPGIGKAARLALWAHPATILGSLLGILALLLAAQGIFRFHLVPLTNAQSLLAILAIIVVKLALATAYRAA